MPLERNDETAIEVTEEIETERGDDRDRRTTDLQDVTMATRTHTLPVATTERESGRIDTKAAVKMTEVSTDETEGIEVIGGGGMTMERDHQGENAICSMTDEVVVVEAADETRMAFQIPTENAGEAQAHLPKRRNLHQT